MLYGINYYISTNVVYIPQRHTVAKMVSSKLQLKFINFIKNKMNIGMNIFLSKACLMTTNVKVTNTKQT